MDDFRPWRCSFVCHEFPPFGGGAASALEALTRTLANRGHTVQVITVGAGRQTTRQEDLAGRRQVVRLGGGRRSSLTPTLVELLGAYVTLHRQAAGLLDAFRPQVVVAFFAFPAGHALPCGGGQQPPRVVWFRGSDVPGFYGRRWHWFRPLHPFLVRPVMEQAQLLLANGEILARLAHDFDPRKPVIALANGIDPEQFRPADTPPAGETPRILAVGQLIPRKGLTHLLAGVHWLAAQGEAAHLTLVGEGPLRHHLATLAARIPPPVTVQLAGYHPREALPRIYRDHHLLAHLSLAEGVSNVLLEGLASGLPVLASQSAVAQSGLSSPAMALLEEVTPETVGQGLLQLIRQRSHWPALRQQARASALRHSWEETAKTFEALVAPLIDGKGNTP